MLFRWLIGMAIIALSDWALSVGGYLLSIGGTAFTAWCAVVASSRSAKSKKRKKASSTEQAPTVQPSPPPCEDMDRATLIAEVAESSALCLPSSRRRAASSHEDEVLHLRLIRGLHTAHLRDLCAATNNGDHLKLPGEAGLWSVYRIQFSDRSAYVGMTGGPVLGRIARHMEGLGSPAVWAHCAGRLEYRFDVLASGLSEHQARERESWEIRALSAPLNKSIPRACS